MKILRLTFILVPLLLLIGFYLWKNNKGKNIEIYENGIVTDTITVKEFIYDPPSIIENGILVQGQRPMIYETLVLEQNPQLDFEQLAATPTALLKAKSRNEQHAKTHGIVIDRKASIEEKMREGRNNHTLFYELSVEYRSEKFLICALVLMNKVHEFIPFPNADGSGNQTWQILQSKFRYVDGMWKSDIEEAFPEVVKGIKLNDIIALRSIIKSRKAEITNGRLKPLTKNTKE